MYKLNQITNKDELYNTERIEHRLIYNYRAIAIPIESDKNDTLSNQTLSFFDWSEIENYKLQCTNYKYG